MKEQQKRKRSALISKSNPDRIVKRFNQAFGFTIQDFENAIQGDQAAMSKIGQMSRKAEVSMKFIPLAKEAMINVMNATGEYNDAYAQLIENGANNLNRSDKAARRIAIASQKYSNTQSEMGRQFKGDVSREELRHSYAMRYIQMSDMLNRHFLNVNEEAKILDQRNRPQMAQVEEDRAYMLKSGERLLTHGDDARLDLMPKKDYVTTNPLQILVGKVKDAIGI